MSARGQGRLFCPLSAMSALHPLSANEADILIGQRWSHFLTQPAKVDSPMQRMIHHEDAETVFG